MKDDRRFQTRVPERLRRSARSLEPRRNNRFAIQPGLQYRLVTPTIARRLTLIVMILLAGLTLGIIFYRQPFRFWKYPLSDLGATLTENGLPNIGSIIFFDGAMVISGLIMFAVSARFAASKVEHRTIKRGLTFLCGIGFFVIMFPYNINDNIHMVGGGAVFGSLWGLTLMFLFELRRTIGWLRFTLLHLPLQVTILPYAALFMIGAPIKQAFQKPAVAGLMLTLLLTLQIRKRALLRESTAS